MGAETTSQLPERQTVRVLIVATTRLFREALARVLAEDSRVAVVGSAAPADIAACRALETRTEVALVDVAAHDGLTTARRLLQTSPELKILGVGCGESDSDVLAWAEAGLVGCLPSECSLEDLLASVETAARGEVLCSPRVTAVLLRRVASFAGDHGREGPETQLTSRQLEILTLIEDGLSNKAIARELCIELPTVKNHVHAILEKLHVHRRVDAAAWAREAGL
jgi:two-component system nitrate/nitrite response regulator NarL